MRATGDNAPLIRIRLAFAAHRKLEMSLNGESQPGLTDPSNPSTLGSADRGTRARGIADAFALRCPPTLPAPGSELIPSAGRHVRCTAESASHIYIGGQTFSRDARSRITARSGMPGGWCIRLAIIESNIAAIRPAIPGSRADPAVLRAQRQFADPAAAMALANILRSSFAGRPIQNDSSSLFVPKGLVFIREASVTLPLSDEKRQDASLAEQCIQTAMTALRGQRAGTTVEFVPPPADAEDEPPRQLRQRGHLRLVQ